MPRYIVGERELVNVWHEVDEAGPDPEMAALGSSMNKTSCGVHYSNDPVDAMDANFPLCPDC